MEHEEGIEKSPVVTPQPQVKKFHLNKWYVITAVLIVVILVQGFLYLNLNSSYNTLNANHKALTAENQNLTNDHDTLTNQYSALQSEHSTLQSQHSALQSEHSTLQGSYDSLQTNYDSLQSNYNSLQSDYDAYISSYDILSNQVNNRVSGVDGKVFITPQDSTVKNLVIQITGGWSNTSDWNECWTDIKLMYDWVVNNIEYRDDGLSPILPSTPTGSAEYGQEMWQLPKETLELKKGDCEDMAVLLTSMILCYN